MYIYIYILILVLLSCVAAAARPITCTLRYHVIWYAIMATGERANSLNRAVQSNVS